MKDRTIWRRLWRADHAVGAMGLLACLSMLSPAFPAHAMGDARAFTEPRIDGADLVRMASLCEATDGLDADAAISLAAEMGFLKVDRIADEVEAFYATRERAFAHRGESNQVLGDNAQTFLGTYGATWAVSFIGGDGTLAVLRAGGFLGLMNDVEVGEGHVCEFLGHGWIEETDAEAALATLVGEDFGGRGQLIPRADEWRNLFSGVERGPTPYSSFSVIIVEGAPGGIPATFRFGYAVVHDMTVPPGVMEGQ